MDNELEPRGVYSNVPGKIRRRMLDVPWQLSLARERVYRSKFGRLYDLVQPYSMLSYARLRALYAAVCHIAKSGVPGDVVECGTARGGSAALMGLALKEVDHSRHLWVYDTFQGLPAPTLEDPDYHIAKHFTGTCRGQLEDVTQLFDRLSISSFSHCVKGMFQETLPLTEVKAVAVLHVDGDWYDSVLTCLECLWERVTPGGIVQIDDYGHWEGARKAVNEFFASRGISPHLRYVDYTGRQIVKNSPLVS
jgi:hypothetical protein